jgi:3-oxoacyl-[acyl-carrier protein] reductase
MKKAGGGTIINTASMAAVRPGPRLSAYSSSKGAVITLTKALATELAPYHIRVNCICPTLTDTPMIANSPERQMAMANPGPFGRMAIPDDVALAALYLASEESSIISGISLKVNGGQV